jgi:GAF domain/Sel1 repeat/PilZ domain
MDRSSGRMPDPIAWAPNGERRRSVRQKLHTPVYASFNGPQTGMVVDLSELLDLHEEGFAVQTSERLETNRAVTLCLDLPETRSFVHGSGQVMWSDDSGRSGIRFSALPESSRQILKQWLFANLLIACSNHAARTEQRARHEEEKSSAPAQTHRSIVSESAASRSDNVIPISDASGVPAPSPKRQPASLQLERVRGEVSELADNLDAALQLITERALSLTGASGAALAFITDDRMICRGRAGEPAPPLGAPVDVKQGLSGECVRTGLIVSCEDMENDARVDPEIGRALGIGSLMAAPIAPDFRVLGLLEIFSPQPHAFTQIHGTVLTRLVEMIPQTRSEKTQPENAQRENPQPETPIRSGAVFSASDSPLDNSESCAVEVEIGPVYPIRQALSEQKPEVPEPVPQTSEEVAEPAPTAPSRLLYRALIGLVIMVVALVLGYLVGPIIEKRWGNSPQASQRPSQSARPQSLAELRNLADHGDADAQWQMAVRYHNGEGVPQDDAQAMQWFQLAADQGNVASQAALGAYYWAGRGVPEDLVKAYMWSTIALRGGDENSNARLEGLASRMTRAQVAAATQQAEAWISQHSARNSAKN